MAKMRIFKFWNESGQEEEKNTTINEDLFNGA